MGADKLGARVRKYREDRSLTREELADAAGLKTEFIAALETTTCIRPSGRYRSWPAP